MRHHRLPILILAAALAAAPAALADSLELDSGGRLSGRLDPKASAERSKVMIELPGGGRAVLDRTEVARAVEEPAELIEYQRRAVRAPDTVETHFAIALWCRDRRLMPQFESHLSRVLELDPDHAEARKLLGYQKQGGRWMTQDERMAARGLVRYGGDFRTPQEIELIERKERSAKRAADWRKRLERWRRDLDSSDPAEVNQAVDHFAALADPGAAGALVGLLKEETNSEAQDLLIRAAAQIDHPATVEALATLSLKDPRHEVRRQCLEHLIRAKRAGLAEIYVRSLSSKNNQIVNRAGEALRVLAADQTISPLIEALVTTHTIKLGKDTPRDTYGMDSRGGFKFGGGGAKTVKLEAKNPEVLSALVEITGQNFQFDKEAWNHWLASRVINEDVDLRRDE